MILLKDQQISVTLRDRSKPAAAFDGCRGSVVAKEDKARSGASVFGREGLMRLMDAARERAFDVVLVEALDRLSRDMEDLAGIHKRLSFLGIKIHAVHDGTADAILVGIRGLVGQMQREDGAKKVRRGMAGVIRDGRHAGGRAYGYLNKYAPATAPYDLVEQARVAA